MPKSLEELRGLLMEWACDVARTLETTTGIVASENAIYEELRRELTYKEIKKILC